MTTTKVERDAARAAEVLNEIGWYGEFVHLPAGMNETAPQRFWSKVRVEDGHWLWTRTVGRDGAGKFTPMVGTCYPAHRVAWMLMRGELGSDLALVHNDSCDLRHCVKPAHRRAVSATEARSLGGRTQAKAGGQPVNCSQRMVDTLKAVSDAGRDIWPACQHIGLGWAAMEQIKKGNARGAQ